MRLYLAENLKYKHTFTGKLWFLMQALTLLLAYGISRGNGINSAYNWWYILMLPGMVTLFTSLVGEKDRKMKNRVVLSVPTRMGRIWDAKILVGMKALLFSNLFGAIANFVLARYLLPAFWMPQVLEISPEQTVAAAAVMTVTTLWQIPFCLWLNQRFGILPTLVINLILNGSGTLMAVTPYWLLNPWAILPRLMTAIIGILPNGLLAIPESMTYTPGITDTDSILPGILVTLVWLVILWGASRLWYDRKGGANSIKGFLRLMKTEEIKMFLCIAVTDSGSGFSEEALRHGTEQFYQADKSRTGKKHYGMGLYIARSVLEENDGMLELRNSREGGGEVRIYVPCLTTF